MTVRSAEVRFYVDADVRGLGIVLGGLRNDLTYPGDPGAVIHKRKRPPCPITTTDLLDGESAQNGRRVVRCGICGR
jgi:hypothetical protein